MYTFNKMDRKHCCLLYSNFSQACRNIVKYFDNVLNETGIELPTVTGMSLLNIDSVFVRNIVKKNIKTVPCLLIEYYGGQTQILENQAVYDWCNAVLKNIVAQQVQVQPSQIPSAIITDEKKNLVQIASDMMQHREKTFSKQNES